MIIARNKLLEEVLFEERMNQYKINRIFVQNQKRVYQHMDDIRNINNEKGNAEESKTF